MARLVIDDIDDATVDRLERRAARNRRSIQAELEALVEERRKMDIAEAAEAARQMQERIGNGPFSDSAELLREDRDR